MKVNIGEKRFYKVIIIPKSTDITEFGWNPIEFKFDDSVRFIKNQETEFTYLYGILFHHLNLEMQDCEEEVYSYFEIDAEGSFDFDEVKSLHSVLLLSLNIAAKDLLKDILVVHTADSNTRWITADFESKTSYNITQKLFELFDTPYERFNLTKEEIENAQTIFPTIKEVLFKDGYSSLKNALIYFLSFTKSRVFEEMIINLSIVLESLFSPAGQNELSHQISFNISKFIAGKPEEAKDIYNKVKKFYGVRSKIVHGAKEKKTNLIGELAIDTYRILQRVLFKILTDTEMRDTFENNEKRRNYLKDLTFGM